MMRMRGFPGLLTVIPVLLAASAMGIALSGLSVIRVRSFEITTDCDSLRTEFLTAMLESLHGQTMFQLRTPDVYTLFDDLQQTEYLNINTSLSGHIRIDLFAKKPVVTVTNTNKTICLNSRGIPFKWQPEHGNLPNFTVNSDLTSDQMMNPDDLLTEFYNLALFMVLNSLDMMQRYTHLADGDDYRIVLSDPVTQNRLILVREHWQTPTLSLKEFDRWQALNTNLRQSKEIDLRFPGLLVMRQTATERSDV